MWNVTNEAYNHCYVNSFAAIWQTTHAHTDSQACLVCLCECVQKTFWGARNILAHVNIYKQHRYTPGLPQTHILRTVCVETFEHELKKKFRKNNFIIIIVISITVLCVKWHKHPHPSQTLRHKENGPGGDVIAGSQHHVGNKQFERSLKSSSDKKSQKKNQEKTIDKKHTKWRNKNDING